MTARKELTLFALNLTGGHLIPEQVGARLDRLIGAVEAERDTKTRAEVLAEAAAKATQVAEVMKVVDEPWASRAGWACASIAAELRRMAAEAPGPAAGQDDTSTVEPERCGVYEGHGEYCDYPVVTGGKHCDYHADTYAGTRGEPGDVTP